MHDETPVARRVITVGLAPPRTVDEDWATVLAATKCQDTEVTVLGVAEPVLVHTFLRTETPWTGELPATHDAVPNKPLFDLDGSPWWAEFVILRLLERAGWRGVWVKNFQGPRVFWTAPKVPLVPPKPQATFFATLERAMGAAKGGRWDLFCWKGDAVLFVEAKGRYDGLIDSQKRWLRVGLAAGLPSTAFLIVRQVSAR